MITRASIQNQITKPGKKPKGKPKAMPKKPKGYKYGGKTKKC